MSELIENHSISSKLSKVSNFYEMESLFTKDRTATNESFKSLRSIIIEDTCKFTKDSMFTHTRKNSMFMVNMLLLIMWQPLQLRTPKFTHLCI